MKQRRSPLDIPFHDGIQPGARCPEDRARHHRASDHGLRPLAPRGSAGVPLGVANKYLGRAREKKIERKKEGERFDRVIHARG